MITKTELILLEKGMYSREGNRFSCDASVLGLPACVVPQKITVPAAGGIPKQTFTLFAIEKMDDDDGDVLAWLYRAQSDNFVFELCND